MARAAIKYTEGLPAPTFEGKIRDARYLVRDDHFIVRFDNGKEYSFPRSALEIDDGSELVSVRVDRKRFFTGFRSPATVTKSHGIAFYTRPNPRTLTSGVARLGLRKGRK